MFLCILQTRNNFLEACQSAHSLLLLLLQIALATLSFPVESFSGQIKGQSNSLTTLQVLRAEFQVVCSKLSFLFENVPWNVTLNLAQSQFQRFGFGAHPTSFDAA